jgi:hypothetical protein
MRRRRRRSAFSPPTGFGHRARSQTCSTRTGGDSSPRPTYPRLRPDDWPGLPRRRTGVTLSGTFPCELLQAMVRSKFSGPWGGRSNAIPA